VAAGDWSYALYLVHTVVIAGVCMIWKRVLTPGMVDNVLAYAVCLGLSLALSALLWIVLERPITRRVGRMMRARRPVRLPVPPILPQDLTSLPGQVFLRS
jgi:peptidoglycan/LPS O-acetylase OafA/YrhL